MQNLVLVDSSNTVTINVRSHMLPLHASRCVASLPLFHLSSSQSIANMLPIRTARRYVSEEIKNDHLSAFGLKRFTEDEAIQACLRVSTC